MKVQQILIDIPEYNLDFDYLFFRKMDAIHNAER